jgi:hypothetical protein
MLRTGILLAVLVLVARSLAAAAAPAGALEDKRLDQRVTLAVKATALADLCDRLRADTGVAFTAGTGVADEKVTVFCKERPLREVMRQLSHPFGYTWLRKGKEGEYRYELEQDLRSRREEEALRARARAAAVQALDREMERYRPYLKLSAEEASARVEHAPPEEKRLLQSLAGPEWGAIHLYFQLSSPQRAALLAGQVLSFDATGSAGRRRLPADVARGTLEGMAPWRATQENGQSRIGSASSLPGGRPLTALPEGRLMVALRADEGELGQLRLSSSTAFFLGTPRGLMTNWQEALAAFNTHMLLTTSGTEGPDAGLIYSSSLAIGKNPDGEAPHNAVANAKHAGEAVMQRTVALRRAKNPTTVARPEAGGGSGAAGGVSPGAERVTSADVLEALHQATGLPIVADFYTRLYPAGDLAVSPAPLFDVLNRLADQMRLRWDEEGEWLQFRGLTYYDDRLQEVPNRLLARWQRSSKEHGALTLDDLTEIAQLTDAQLDAAGMAQGARLLWGLAEWDLACARPLRPHLRYLATLSPAQRQQAERPTGLPFPQLSRAQQQPLLVLALGSQAGTIQPTPADLAAGTLRIEYTVPGWFRWQGVAPENQDAPNAPAPLPPIVRERTAAAALEAARRVDPRVTAGQIRPTSLNLRVSYFLGATKERRIQRSLQPTGVFFDAPR